ncbi:MAG TPA: acyltransferase family protein [Rhizobacter sp.]|nr:acyltransferase family protein [Rhizobacter sp.]
MTRPEPAASQRLHGLDAVRAAALLLGICLHAALSFLPGVDPLVWPITDTQKSVPLGLLSFLIHVFRMSVFFMVAGLFAHMLYHRLGWRGFWRNRLMRIALPLAGGWVICYTLVIGIVLWAVARAHQGHLPDPLPPQFAGASPNFLHLWFLYVLLWLYAIVTGLRRLWCAIDVQRRFAALADRLLRWALSSPAGPLCLALPVATALFLEPDWLVLHGVPTPGYTLLPPLVPLFIYAWVFGLGWLLDRQRHLLDGLAARWPRHLVIGLVGVGVALYLYNRPDIKPVLALAYATGLTYWTLAFIGAGLRFFSRASATVRYLSDASYWMYLMHLPVIFALQTALMLADWHWAIKYLLINVASFAILLLSYRHAVRPTWVGLLLNGRRRSRGAEA